MDEITVEQYQEIKEAAAQELSAMRDAALRDLYNHPPEREEKYRIQHA